MAIKLENKLNVQAPNAAYPYGAIKDNTGGNNGTPVNASTYGDFHQFFAKMLAESGVVANDLPDNFTNGFQYFEALLALINGDTTAWAPLTIGGSYGGNVFYRRIKGIVYLRGAIDKVGGDYSSTIATLPVGFRPVSDIKIAGVYFGGGTEVLSVDINSAGVITGDAATVYGNLSFIASFPMN
jgi:hypothetical protein